MSDRLATEQAKLVEALLADRVPDGFDPKGIRATAKILRHKLRRHPARGSASAVGARGIAARLHVLRAATRLVAWLKRS